MKKKTQEKRFLIAPVGVFQVPRLMLLLSNHTTPWSNCYLSETLVHSALEPC